MRMLRSAAAAVSLLALAACQPAAKVGPPPATGALSIAPLSYTERTLPNGLRVYAMPDSSTASASVAVWYDVGGRDDPPGRSGFAHLFEHIMFKATSNTPAEFFDRLTEDVGGFNNASTNDDYTDYYETVPANHLERVLWAEAQRMGSLVIDEANFKSERDVVKEEFRQSVLSSPYGKLFYLYLPQTFYDVHPYGRSVIGSIQDLDAATIEDVRQFHAAYYRPDNAVLVVSGNFDPKQLDQWVDKYFAPVAKPNRALDRTQVTEPKRTAPKSVTVYEANVPLPAVAISYPGPDARSPDYPAWMMLDAILSRGQSSRLYQSLVYEKKLATQVMTFQGDTETPGAYSLIAILSDGKSPDDGVSALKAEIAKLRDGEVTAAELDEARNELITATLRSRETSDGRASELAANVVLHGDPKFGDTLLAKLQTVSAADIQALARKLFDDNAAVTIRYLPKAMANGAKGDVITPSPKTEAKAISIPAAEIPNFTLAPEDKREKPPEPGKPISAVIPGASEKTLANGLRVIVANKPGLPLLSALLRMPAGAGIDPDGKYGLAAMTADVAQRGTATRSATDISRQIESLGADLNAGADADSAVVSVSTRSDKAAQTFAVMADVIEHPAFKQEELDRAKQETLDGLKVQLSSPSGLGSRAMSRLLFGDSRYGKVATPTSIGAITQEDVSGFAKTHWMPQGAVLVIAGDVTPDAGFKLAEDAFGGWAGPTQPGPKGQGPSMVPLGVRSVVIDMPDMGQAYVSYGLQGPARRDPDYIPTLLATEVLGGGYSARLNEEIRIKRGLSYGAYARFSARLSAPPLLAYAQTRNDAVAQVVDLAAKELTRIGAEPIPADELDARKAVLISGFGRSVETTRGLAGELGELAQFALPLAKLQSYQADIAAVTPEQASAAAKAHFDLTKANLVVVGDAKVFWSAVKAKAPKAERIEAKTLNLDSPSLK